MLNAEDGVCDGRFAPAASPVPTPARSFQTTATVTSSHAFSRPHAAEATHSRSTASAHAGGNRALATMRATASARLRGSMPRNSAALPPLLPMRTRRPPRSRTRWTKSWCSWRSAASVRRPEARRRTAPWQVEAAKAKATPSGWVARSGMGPRSVVAVAGTSSRVVCDSVAGYA
ncbi:hypothetical protein VPH35_038430 [Triticum aestivum]|uniref:Uncharacterized protein n=1 Tax=Aegilops tauschii subsp. strangulata TaxID=200361 RepID=A0A453CCE6_AEGTS